MAAIKKTIGTGGDYAGPAEAYDFLVGVGSLANDYTLDLISSVTITAWNAILSKIDCNGHTVTFTCSFNEANADRPDLWYRVVLSGVNGHMTMIQDLGATVADVINVEWWYYEHASNTAVIMLYIYTQQSSDTMTWSVKNCWFEGYGTIGESGIGAGNTKHYYDINNIVMFNLRVSLNLYPGGFVPGDDFPDRKHITDMTIYTSNGGTGVTMGDLPGNNIYFVNVSVFRVGGGACWAKSAGTSPDRFRLSNCSDDDNTIVTVMAPSATLTDNQANVVIGDNIESVDSSDLGDGFLELIEGTTSGGSYISGAPDLGQTGKDSGLTKDIYDRDVPGISGDYSIGAFQQQYANTYSDVMLIQNKITITHSRYNEFSFPLNLGGLCDGC